MGLILRESTAILSVRTGVKSSGRGVVALMPLVLKRREKIVDVERRGTVITLVEVTV